MYSGVRWVGAARDRFRSTEIDAPFQGWFSFRGCRQIRDGQRDFAELRCRRTRDRILRFDPDLSRRASLQAAGGRRVQGHAFGQRDAGRLQLRGVGFGRAGIVGDRQFGGDPIGLIRLGFPAPGARPNLGSKGGIEKAESPLQPSVPSGRVNLSSAATACRRIRRTVFVVGWDHARAVAGERDVPTVSVLPMLPLKTNREE